MCSHCLCSILSFLVDGSLEHMVFVWIPPKSTKYLMKLGNTSLTMLSGWLNQDTNVFVLDNIDWEEKAYDVRKDSQNKNVDAVATSRLWSTEKSKNLQCL